MTENGQKWPKNGGLVIKIGVFVCLPVQTECLEKIIILELQPEKLLAR